MKQAQQVECGGCGAPERLLLHNIRHRASYRRLCTDCVLKNHHGLFCPVCLEVFNESPPPHQRLICLKCPAITHLSCSSSSSGSSFTCPPCSNPNFSFFGFTTNKKPKSTPDRSNGDENENRAIDMESAKALLAAAKIAAASMTKAAAVARMEAERRVKEATLTKKRAKEALESLVFLARKDNDRLKSKADATATAAAVSAAATANPKSNNAFSSSPLPFQGNSNCLYNVSPPPSIAIPDNKLQHQHSAHGMPN